MKHLNIKIYGRVHMVLFRYSAKKIAEKLGLYGFIKNERDGTVYIEAEGKETVLQEFLEWCNKGPELANVKKVIVKEAPIKNFTNFEIKF